MTGKVIRIERTDPRAGGPEEPYYTTRGYKLGDPAKGDRKHAASNAVFVRTLDEAAALVDRGYSLWMTRPGKRPSLISPGSLQIIRSL